MEAKQRLDHYLFRARLFKSRTKATTACREGKVLLNERAAAAASDVRAGDLLKIRERGLYRHIRVLTLPERNLSKQDAKETWRDETPDEIRRQRELIELATRTKISHREGARPTKKERRELEKVRRHK